MNTEHTGRREELLALIQSIDQSLGKLQAIQLEAIAEFTEKGGSDRSVTAELALGLRITEHQAGRQVVLARELTTRLPRTFAALKAGAIDSYKASKIAEPIAILTNDKAGEADEIMATRLTGKNPTGIRRAVQRVILAVDPEGAEDRSKARRETRKVQLVHQDDCMATLIADMPAETASAIYARCDREARRLRRQGDQRTLEQLRADALAGLTVGEDGGGGRAEVFVYVAGTTLLGLDDHPAELAGHGYIPAWLARQIAGKPNSVWRRIVTDPLTGHPVDLGRTRYKPPAALDEFVRIRDRECRTPGCNRPAHHNQNDHTHDWDYCGGTREAGLTGHCEKHHHLKDEPGWHHHLDNHELTITTPTGTTPHQHTRTTPRTGSTLHRRRRTGRVVPKLLCLAVLSNVASRRMRAILRNDLKAALKSRDRIAITALRSALAAIDNAEAVPVEHSSSSVDGNEHVAGTAVGVGSADVARRQLTDADLRSIVEKEVRERTTAAADYEQRGHDDHAKRLRAEADVLSRHLAG